MKSLVVYYSRSGNTRKVADIIGKKLGSDMEEIIDNKNRRGMLGFLTSGNEAHLKKIIPIEDIKSDLSQYDLIIVGTPIWAGNISTPIYSFLHKYKEKIIKFAFFSTSMGTDPQKNFFSIEKIVSQKPIAVANITTHALKRGYHQDLIDKFVKDIKKI